MGVQAERGKGVAHPIQAAAAMTSSGGDDPDVMATAAQNFIGGKLDAQPFAAHHDPASVSFLLPVFICLHARCERGKPLQSPGYIYLFECCASPAQRNQMPRNVEVKARIHDWERTLQVCKQLSGSNGEQILQRDVFFNTTKDRLKLRDFQDGTGQLIYYERPDQLGPKLSNYSISNTADPNGLEAVLTQALGVRGKVVKERFLFLVGQTRIHLDRVKDLGDFLELEVVLIESQTAQDGDLIAQELMNSLKISQDDLLTGAYMDLLQDKKNDHLSETVMASS
ncbi:uncharacterized protein LOC130367426 [Hyla sarda]|uniref:uncharacterized protein LOC130367426 n=1 Tax=Hyla sarda TaxID=327740 RepID=UPI0024C256FD|nr:uncharacterized protein LOC130367426 [Hyla sarda]